MERLARWHRQTTWVSQADPALRNHKKPRNPPRPLRVTSSIAVGADVHAHAGSAEADTVTFFIATALSAKGLQPSVGRQITNPLSLEPLSAGSLGPLSNTGRTTTGTHHEENSFSNGCYSRIHCTFVRAGQNRRSSAAIRCLLVLRGSGCRDDEMSNCHCPACSWWQHEGYRCRSFDTCISGNSFDGRQDLHQVMK